MTHTLTPQAIDNMANRISNRLTPETTNTLNAGDMSVEAQTAIKDAVIPELPTLAQLIDTPDARRILRVISGRMIQMPETSYLRTELNATMRDMYQVPQSMGLEEELNRIVSSPAVARVAELKAQHEKYRADIQTALEQFAELANDYAEEQSACGQFERAMSTLWAIAPAGYDSMPRRTVSTTVRITELIDIELPRDDEGDADYDAMDVDDIRENGWSHGAEVEPY